MIYLNLFIILWFYFLYIFKHLFTTSTLQSHRKCNNVVILSLIIFCLNWNQHVNSNKYKIFWNPAISHRLSTSWIWNWNMYISLICHSKYTLFSEPGKYVHHHWIPLQKTMLYDRDQLKSFQLGCVWHGSNSDIHVRDRVYN
jgi:hypothetical protein